VFLFHIPFIGHDVRMKLFRTIVFGTLRLQNESKGVNEYAS